MYSCLSALKEQWSEGHLFTASTLSIGPQVIFTVFILLWLWLIPVPFPIFILQLLFQPLFQTQLVLRKPVQVCPSLLTPSRYSEDRHSRQIKWSCLSL